MSVVFVIANENQLQPGVDWCKRLMQPSIDRPTIHLVVADPSRKTLAEYIKRKLEQSDDQQVKYQTTVVDKDAVAVLKFATSVSCEKLVLHYHPDELKLQQTVFKESTCPTIWMRPGATGSIDSNRLIRLFSKNAKVTDLAAQQLFGQAPSASLQLDDPQEADDLPALVLAAITESSVGPDDLLLCGVDQSVKSDPHFSAGLMLLKQEKLPTIALIHSGDSLIESLIGKVRAWGESIAPLMERQHRIDLANELQTGSQPNLEYLGLISAASMLAAFGLLQDSAAVIIGAMLIAPLMTPILGAGLALTQGNRPLFKSAVLTITLGFAGALCASIAFGWLYWLFRAPEITPEMWARCQPSPLDFCVGLVGGLAASYARTRSHLSSALAGAAIAAALVPPISTAGLQIAFGFFERTEQGNPVSGPLLLVSINVLTIMIGSSFVLWARGMRVERTLHRADRWVLRVLALLVTLALLILTWVVIPH
jgi:uncharacterized hydrophobic protein (TIGR00271 family)